MDEKEEKDDVSELKPRLWLLDCRQDPKDGGDPQWETYDDFVSVMLEKRYIDFKRKSIGDTLIKISNQFQVDIQLMEQREVNGGKGVRAVRRGIPAKEVRATNERFSSNVFVGNFEALGV